MWGDPGDGLGFRVGSPGILSAVPLWNPRGQRTLHSNLASQVVLRSLSVR